MLSVLSSCTADQMEQFCFLITSHNLSAVLCQCKRAFKKVYKVQPSVTQITVETLSDIIISMCIESDYNLSKCTWSVVIDLL